MRLSTFTALAGILILAIALFVGCSNDKTANPVTYGDIQDPAFAPVKDQIDGVLDDVIGEIRDGIDNLYVQPGDTNSVRANLMPPGIEPDSGDNPDTLITEFSNYWYYVYASFTGTDFVSHIADSIQYQQDGTPIEGPTVQADYIHAIGNWSIEALDEEVSHLNLSGRNEYEFSNLDQDTATINGTSTNFVEVVYIATDTTLTDNYSFELAIDDIDVPKAVAGWSSICPLHGTISMTLTRQYEWTGPSASGSGSGTWTASIHFDNAVATITASNGTATWRYTTNICGSAS